MESMELSLSGICDAIYKISKYALLIITSAMIIAVTVNVVCRYVFSMGFFWVEELCRYGLVWATFLGASCGYRRHELVAMTMLIERTRHRTAWKIGLFCELAILVMLAFGFVYGIKVTMMVFKQISPGMQISMSLPYSILPISLSLMMVFNIDNVLRYLIRKEEYSKALRQGAISQEGIS